MTRAVVIGIFVGGAGLRMGGMAKGRLRTPDGSETLVERLLRVSRAAAPSAELRLVGNAEAYAELGVTALEDVPSGVGPIGGLCALLREARHADAALALACDLPFLDESVISTLLAPLTRAARVPFVAEHWQPLAAAYAPGPTLAAAERALARNRRSLMSVLDELGDDIERASLDPRLLHDWDTPADVQR